MSLSAERGGFDLSLERLGVDPVEDREHRRADRAGRVLERVAPAGVKRLLAHPADGAFDLARGRRLLGRPHEHVAAADVESVGKPERHGHRWHRHVGAVERVQAGDRRTRSGRHHHHLIARRERPGDDPTGIQAIVVRWASHPLDRQPQTVQIAIGLDVDLLEVFQQGRPAVERRPVGSERDVVAVQRADRHDGEIEDVEASGEVVHLIDDLGESALIPADQVHLVHAHDHVLDSEQGSDVGVTARLGDHPAAGVDQHDRDVGGGRAREHVARVALVAGGVGEDERAASRSRRTGRRRRS